MTSPDSQRDATEAWMRGPLAGVSPWIAPTLFSYQQAREDLAKHIGDLTIDQLWARPFGLVPVGFHLTHIAGSVRRLTTYLQDRALTEADLLALSSEIEPGLDAAKLLTEVRAAFDASEAVLRGFDPSRLEEPRWVGRRRLPTTAIGLVIHLAEHTQRHVGQAIAAAKLARHVTITN